MVSMPIFLIMVACIFLVNRMWCCIGSSGFIGLYFDVWLGYTDAVSFIMFYYAI